MLVAITRDPRLSASAPTLAWNLDSLRIVSPLFDLLPDGKLVGIQKGESEDEIKRLDAVLNFDEELRARFR